MISPGLADTIMNLQKGRAMIEVTEIRPANNVRINEHGSSTQLLKPGLYDFDADRGLIRVFDGKALVQTTGQNTQLKRGRQLSLNTGGKLKPVKFDEKASMDDFYRWASLRSSYLAEANVDAARTYAGGSGWAPGGWYGDGWYWNPWFDAYTFIPGDGIFFDPFGWGFYSPWYAFGAPYLGFGYGYGYGGGYYRHFGPGYRAPLTAGNRSVGGRGSAVVGHAYHAGGVGAGFGRASSFAGGGFRGGGGIRGGGGFSGGGGFHGGGSGFHGGGGGGFHGGGGGGHGR